MTFLMHAEGVAEQPLPRPRVTGWVRVAVVAVAVVAGAAGAGRVRAGLVRDGGAGAGWGN